MSSVEVANVHQKIKLLLLTDTAIGSAGGSERFLRNLSARLPKDRYQITLVQLSPPADSNQANSHSLSALSHIDIQSIPIGAVYSKRGIDALSKLRVLVREKQFDIIHSQHEKSDMFNVLLPEIPGVSKISNRRDMGFNKSSRVRFFLKLMNHRFDCIVAPAQSILESIEEQEAALPAKLTWIPNGVDTDRFSVLAQTIRSQMRAEHSASDNDFIFGIVASLSQVKRHCDLLDAFAIVHRQRKDTKLWLIGDGPLRHELENQAQQLGITDSITFFGSQPEVEKLLPLLDASLLVSSTEGMSNAVLEAMASGLPFIATAVGGNVQLIDHERTGLLVPACQPQQLAEAMHRIIDDELLRERLGTSARAHIETFYSMNTMVQSYDALFTRLAGR